MNQTATTTLLILNVACTAALGGWLLNRKPEQATKANPPSSASGPAVTVDFAMLQKPIEDLDGRLASLTTTLQRFNTSLIQYDFLDKELDSLVTLERGLAVRAQAIATKKTKENEKDTEAAMGQLKELSTKVQQERVARRQTMLLLISGLEKQLAGLNGATTVADKVPQQPAAVDSPALPLPEDTTGSEPPKAEDPADDATSGHAPKP